MGDVLYDRRLRFPRECSREQWGVARDARFDVEVLERGLEVGDRLLDLVLLRLAAVLGGHGRVQQVERRALIAGVGAALGRLVGRPRGVVLGRGLGLGRLGLDLFYGDGGLLRGGRDRLFVDVDRFRRGRRRCGAQAPARRSVVGMARQQHAPLGIPEEAHDADQVALVAAPEDGGAQPPREG